MALKVIVMAGLDPAIQTNVPAASYLALDGRLKGGHDSDFLAMFEPDVTTH